MPTQILPDTVIVHPLVLLSVVDHYHRVIGPSSISISLTPSASINEGSNGSVGSIGKTASHGHQATTSLSNANVKMPKRVVGVLLGQFQSNGSTVNISNSYAVPFEEDEKNPEVWFLDHNYHETMNDLFKKVNAKEKIVGWYHTGPKLRPSDIHINELFKKYVPHPVLVVIDVEPRDTEGLPTKSYMAVEDVTEGGNVSKWTFAHLSNTIEAEDAEEIGVEHLLRDIRDHTFLTPSSKSSSSSLSFKTKEPLARQLNEFLGSLKSFTTQLEHILSYLNRVLEGKYPFNQHIFALIQELFNYLPDVTHSTDWKNAALVKSNDEMANIYIGSLVRAIVALHKLIDNKIQNKEEEKKLDCKEKSTINSPLTDKSENNVENKEAKTTPAST